ncbi:hypothetical protein ACQPYA_00280 [Micromonospora sp. CA-263727]|uniref:hypothetical protein n=1 Tax=Micromonospora sp. CA-263727 TaxID=3239967 RepID=UPI003D8CE351
MRVACGPGEPVPLPLALLAQQLVVNSSNASGGLRRPEVHLAVDDQQLPLHAELAVEHVQVGAAYRDGLASAQPT